MPSPKHWVGRVSGLDQVLGSAAGLGGLGRHISSHSEPMVTVQRLLRSDIPVLGLGVGGGCHPTKTCPRTTIMGHSQSTGAGVEGPSRKTWRFC